MPGTASMLSYSYHETVPATLASSWTRAAGRDPDGRPPDPGNHWVGPGP